MKMPLSRGISMLLKVRYERGTEVRKALLISHRLDQLGAGHMQNKHDNAFNSIA